MVQHFRPILGKKKTKTKTKKNNYVLIEIPKIKIKGCGIVGAAEQSEGAFSHE